MHEIADPACVAPVAVLAVRHVDDVDPCGRGIGHTLHYISAGPGKGRTRLHWAESTVANGDGDLCGK